MDKDMETGHQEDEPGGVNWTGQGVDVGTTESSSQVDDGEIPHPVHHTLISSNLQSLVRWLRAGE